MGIEIIAGFQLCFSFLESIFSSDMLSWSPWNYSFNPLVQLQEHIILASCILMLTCFNPYKFSLHQARCHSIFICIDPGCPILCMKLTLASQISFRTFLVVLLSFPAFAATVFVFNYCVRWLYVIVIKKNSIFYGYLLG